MERKETEQVIEDVGRLAVRYLESGSRNHRVRQALEIIGKKAEKALKRKSRGEDESG